ncbi:MAG: peptidylprolyl isomerase [Myxococcota bacterium]|nr:peptidylprolyl isomerase [Myxococcota bacterium]
MRCALIALLVACSSTPTPSKPTKIDDTAVRIRVAYAEARRGGGIAELVDLAARGQKHERVLALRGLGRIGGATALEALRAGLNDPDRDVVAAAAAAIGLMASLDDEDLKVTEALLAKADQPAVIEALGRAGDASSQAALAKLVATSPEAGIALGRHGRRKIALSDEARAALIAALSSPHRYAAAYALAREHIDKPDAPHLAITAAALTKLIDDPDPEVRATAIAGIAKKKQVTAHAPAIEAKLIDADWRVAIEAVRALSADEYRPAVIAAALRAGDRGHLKREVLSSLIGKQIDVNQIESLVVGGDRYFWYALVGASTQIDEALRLAKTHPQRHLRLGFIGEWLKSKAPIAERRIALAALLADADVRVRAAGMGALASIYTDGDQRDREFIVSTVVAAIASEDPLLSGTAIEAADELYENEATRGALGAALVLRADNEKDVELAGSLYGVIGKRAIGSGAAACKQGLDGHAVLAKAAVECLKKLGEPAPTLTNPREAKPPFVNVTEVIGRRVTWTVKTSKGDVAIELRPDVAPWAVATVVTLTKRGYYDGLEFHRVVPNFVVQGGDPTESGWGGPGFMIPAEPGSVLDGAGFVAGGVGIADAGRDSGGSQWFVMHSRAAHLDGRYTWIGSVVKGGKTADALVIGDEIVKATVSIE